jgi:diaminohydroxyphosphoribosylaminopyrimidine deaminase/5-amino-6-(5-phosphoribosylamino)uracil reductase
MVGAVVVKKGRIIGRGAHRVYGGPHAEVEALEEAGRSAKGAILYVTLEPCCHFGKTPPCTDRVIESGVAEVVAGMRDPFPEVAGKGFRKLRHAGIEVWCGVMEDECRRLNEGFIKRIETGRPFVTVKSAMTMDGRIATRMGKSKWITSETARKRVQRLRYEADIVLTGSGTVLADDPMLTPRGRELKKPEARRAILHVQGGLPLDRRIFRTASEGLVLLFVPKEWNPPERRRLEDLGVVIHGVPMKGNGLDLRSVLRILGKKPFNTVLVEAGSRVAGSFFDAGLVDRWVCHVAPMVLGDECALPVLSGRFAPRLSQAKRFRVTKVSRLGPDVEIICEP